MFIFSDRKLKKSDGRGSGITILNCQDPSQDPKTKKRPTAVPRKWD